MSFRDVVLLMLPTRDNVLPDVEGTVSAGISGQWYRQSDNPPFWQRGDIHGGIDFQYFEIEWSQQNDGAPFSQGPVNTSHPPVYSPVTGTVEFIDASLGMVVIKSDLDETRHRILHLDAISVNVGDQLNTLGDDEIGTLGSTDAGTVIHVHYDVYLPDADGYSIDGLDNRINPIVYWSRGAEVSSLALRDIDEDGTIDTSGFLTEDTQSLISIEVNTPHTRDLIVRVQFESDDPDFLGFDFSNELAQGSGDSMLAYFSIPATINQEFPITTSSFAITPREDADFTAEVVTYSIDAGFFDANGQWVSYAPDPDLLGPPIFNEGIDPVTDRTLIILDNDTPQLDVSPSQILAGTAGNDADRIVGSLTLVMFRIPTGLRAWIEDVVVDAAARRQGVAEALNREALRRATEAGARTVELCSRPSREAAIRLYQKLGFKERDTNVYRFEPRSDT